MTRAVPWLCAGLHLLALAALALWLRPGTEWDPDLLRRARYIADHRGAWRAGWALWMLAAPSLVGFYAWWAAHLPREGGRTAAVLVAAAGMACDLVGEATFIGVLVERASGGNLAGLADAQRWGTLLTAGAANGLYAAAGVLLTRKTTGLPRRIRAAMWATWTAAAAMTLCALLGEATGMVVSSAVLFPLLIAWTVWMALFWKRA